MIDGKKCYPLIDWNRLQINAKTLIERLDDLEASCSPIDKKDIPLSPKPEKELTIDEIFGAEPPTDAPRKRTPAPAAEEQTTPQPAPQTEEQATATGMQTEGQGTPQAQWEAALEQAKNTSPKEYQQLNAYYMRNWKGQSWNEVELFLGKTNQTARTYAALGEVLAKERGLPLPKK